MKRGIKKRIHSFGSQLKVHQTFIAINQTMTDIDNGWFFFFFFPAFNDVSVLGCSFQPLLLSESCECLPKYLTFSCNIEKVSLRFGVPAGPDHRSQQSCRSRQMKTNMLGWYHLICSTPLSSKISLYYPPYPHAPTPLNQTYSSSPCTLWGKSLCVEAESECKPLLWCNRTPQ